MPEPQRYHDRLRGQTAIVTGAGTDGDGVGTGRAIAIVLAGEGANVCLVDREAPRADATRERIARSGGRAFVATGDVTQSADCERFVAETIEQFGRVDILVNNVGISQPVYLESVDDASWSRVFDVNLKSAMLMCKFAIPAMIAAGAGSIINISSIAGMRGHGGIAYGPSKAAMIALARDIAVTYGCRGIRANTVAPGHIMTPHAMHVLPSDARAARVKVGPLRIEGDAWDVALAVLFLACEESRFITATLLPVDGGVTEIGPLVAHAQIMAD